MERMLRVAILKKFDTQADFADAVSVHESKVSQVIRGRRKLSSDDAARWSNLLECDPTIMESVKQCEY